MPVRPLDLAVVRQLALRLPNVEDATSARGTGFTVAGRLLACEAIHESAEQNSLMVRVSLNERARLIAEDPLAYYVTKHYASYPAVLVRLSRMNRNALRDLLATSWLFVSEKAVRKKAKPVEARRGRAKVRRKPRSLS